MQPLYEGLQRAIELAMNGKLHEAQTVLDEVEEPLAVQLRAFFAQQRLRDTKRASALAAARHDLGNALSIAQSSVEAMLDGIVQITDSRLNRIREILAAVSDSMYELTAEGASEPRTGDLIADVSRLSALAEAKGVSLSYEPGCDAYDSRRYRALLKVVRFTPSGGAVRVGCSTDSGLLLSASSAIIAKLFEGFDGTAHLLSEKGGRATLLVAL